MRHGDQDMIFTDERGWPKVSGIHDARMKALSMEFGRTLTLDAVGASGESTKIVFDGLHMLNIEGVWEGVIVDSLWVWRVTEYFDPAPHDEASRTWSALLAGRIHFGGETSEIARLKRKHDGELLAAITSSYGGELQVLCRDVSINGQRVEPI